MCVCVCVCASKGSEVSFHARDRPHLFSASKKCGSPSLQYRRRFLLCVSQAEALMLLYPLSPLHALRPCSVCVPLFLYCGLVILRVVMSCFTHVHVRASTCVARSLSQNLQKQE